MLIVIFAVCGTTFTILSDRRFLGKATTEIANGLVSKVSGGSGMDFGRDWADPAADTCDYIWSAHCARLFRDI